MRPNDMKTLQCAKLQELRAALRSAGLSTVDQQAKALGLSRSTTWFVMTGNYKTSGLSATLINRMLAAHGLPAAARTTLLKYAHDKAAGAYGHNESQRRRFVTRLTSEAAGLIDCDEIVPLQPSVRDNDSLMKIELGEISVEPEAGQGLARASRARRPRASVP
jgi:hypothetical protein